MNDYKYVSNYLRHSVNVLGIKFISKELNVDKSIIEELIYSDIHGSNYILDILKDNNPYKEIKNLIKKDEEKKQQIYNSKIKNQLLAQDLDELRTGALGIGTNKIKRRLNKLSNDNLNARIIRLMIEIEDINIQAKKYHHYSDKKYKQKEELLNKLINIYIENNLKFGYHDSEDSPSKCIYFFELDGGLDQISWHSTTFDSRVKKYENKWDGLVNSTLKKLLIYIQNNFSEIIY